MSYIILTEQEAAAVRGTTKAGSALEPVLLNDGSYALPVRVLDDPAHAIKSGALSSKQQRDVAADEFASYIAPEPEPPLPDGVTAEMIEAGVAAGGGKVTAEDAIAIYNAMVK